LVVPPHWIDHQHAAHFKASRNRLGKKDHRVIALIDTSFYSNRYECSEKAANLFSRKEDRKLLLDAIALVDKQRTTPGSATGATGTSVVPPWNGGVSPELLSTSYH
jgi:hypothetical protein